MNVIYARKSSESEDRQVLSIPAQLAELHAHAEIQGCRIDKVLEESRSAREPGRPVFGQLLALLERGEVENLYVWKLDRLARNPVDGGLLVHLLGHRRLKSIVTLEGTFTGTGNDKLLMQLQVGMATKYVDDLSDNVKRGNREVLKSGRITGPPPLGYVKHSDGGDSRGKGARQVVPDPARFPLVRRLWEMMGTGRYPLSQIRREAEVIGLRTRGSKRFKEATPSISGLSQMFQNRFYCGELVSAGQTYKGAHVPMVTIEEFRRVRAVLEGIRGPGKRWSKTFTFSGFLRCASCARTMVGEDHRNLRYGCRYVYYRCARNPVYTRCSEPYVPEPVVLSAIQDTLAAMELPPSIAGLVEEYIDRWADRRLNEMKSVEESVRGQIARMESALHNLTSLAIHGDITRMEFREQRTALTSELDGLREKDTDARHTPDKWRSAVREALSRADNARTRFERGDLAQRRSILGDVLDHITVRAKIPTVHLRGHFASLVDVASTQDVEKIVKDVDAGA